METEIIVLSEYYNIISNLIEKHCFDSLFKIEMTAFMIVYHKNDFLSKSSSNNHIKIFFSSFLTALYSKSRDLKAINECVYILEKEGFIRVKNDEITKIKTIPCVSDIYMNKVNVYETMEIVNKLSIGSFVEDLITYA